MARYHLNPTTGDPGVCRAEKYCPFGDMDEDHFATKSEARKHYEEMMSSGDLQFHSVAKVSQRPAMDNAVGLNDAQFTFVKNFNEQFTSDPDFIGPNVENYTSETIDRYLAGEKIITPSSYWTEALEPKDRLLSILTNDSQSLMSTQVLYLATIFPERELRGVLDHMNDAPQFTVSTFQNGRENGLVYSVMQPDGALRSFSLYEHRNSDSIVINGKENWDGNELPYAADSKHQFFAEFSYEDYPQAASSLAFYMSEASKGELGDDAYLCATAEKIDWVARLSEQIPAFGEWAKENGYEKDKKRWFED